MKLYNSLTKKKQVFHPHKDGHVGVYSCGPTVYDHVHIGNLRSFITADLLVRTLREVGGYEVEWVMNTTDIDDKIIDRLARDYADIEPQKARADLTQKYEKLFLSDIEAVGVDIESIKLVRASEHIKQMQDMIRGLLKSDIAYIVDGSVYFSILKYQQSGHNYGLLSKVDFDRQSRLSDDQDQKEGLADFALWKAEKSDEPAWDFMIDGDNLRGRPGWHIECSAMSTYHLGTQFDIHTGGVDLRFPHHENEIAQCGGRQARFYIHNEMLMISGDKMSKSLNNFYKLAQIKDGRAFRYLVLGAHYRSKMDFSETALAGARTRLNHIDEFVSKLLNNKLSNKTGKSLAEKSHQQTELALKDDLNSPLALASLAEITRSNELDSQSMLNAIRALDRAIGLGIDESKLMLDRTGFIDLLEQREQARRAKDYAKSDSLRLKLNSIGVGIEDTPVGPLVWKLSS